MKVTIVAITYDMKFILLIYCINFHGISMYFSEGIFIDFIQYHSKRLKDKQTTALQRNEMA